MVVDAESEEEDAATIRRAAAGDQEALAFLFHRHRKRLRQMVRLRLDRRLQGRVDPSDVLQEAFLDLDREAARVCQAKIGDSSVSLVEASHRRAALADSSPASRPPAMRDAGREVSGLHRGALPQASSVSLAAQLLGRYTSASHAIIRARGSACSFSRPSMVHGPGRIARSSPYDTSEELSNGEAATVLGIQPPGRQQPALEGNDTSPGDPQEHSRAPGSRPPGKR